MKTLFSRHGLTSLLILSVAQVQALAQEVAAPKLSSPAPSPTPPVAVVTPSTTAYRATTKSTFVPPEKGRNPFWPIGFTPRAKTAINEEQLLRIPIEQYKVTSIILDSPSIAVINGKDFTRGQFLNLATATGTIKLLITNIEDGFVTVQYKALIGKIPISRK